jgi:hypothetical protein
VENSEAIDTTTWSIVDHACRTCGGRVLASADGARVRCADCDASATGGPDSLCWCGALPAGSRARLKCVRNKHPTPESPGAIVAIEDAEDAAAQPTDVQYMQVDGCDKRFFRCTILRSTLSTEGCSANWRRAQRISAEELGFTGKCRGCPVGAMHSGRAAVHYSALYGAQIYPRTRRWASRMIGNRLGISSFNREREWLVGKNAKGRTPQLVLAPRGLGVITAYGEENQRYVEIRDDRTVDTLEIAFQVLRVVHGRAAFCRPRGGPSISTADLARQYMAPERSRGIIAHAKAVPPKTRPAAPPIDRMPKRKSLPAATAGDRRRCGDGARPWDGSSGMNQRTRAHGRAGDATLRWLHGREVPDVSLHRPVDHAQEPEPNGREAIETAIALVLASVVAEMLHLGADGRHLAIDREDVQRALAMAARLGDGDPVDHLEPVFDDLCATLTSSRVKQTIAALANALLKAPAGEMAADHVLETIILGMAAALPDGADQPAHPRKIFVR